MLGSLEKCFYLISLNGNHSDLWPSTAYTLDIQAITDPGPGPQTAIKFMSNVPPGKFQRIISNQKDITRLHDFTELNYNL